MFYMELPYYSKVWPVQDGLQAASEEHLEKLFLKSLKTIKFVPYSVN